MLLCRLFLLLLEKTFLGVNTSIQVARITVAKDSDLENETADLVRMIHRRRLGLIHFRILTDAKEHGCAMGNKRPNAASMFDRDGGRAR